MVVVERDAAHQLYGPMGDAKHGAAIGVGWSKTFVVLGMSKTVQEVKKDKPLSLLSPCHVRCVEQRLDLIVHGGGGTKRSGPPPLLLPISPLREGLVAVACYTLVSWAGAALVDALAVLVPLEGGSDGFCEFPRSPAGTLPPS